MDGWLCFTVEGAKNPCNWSGSLCLLICFALASVHDSQAGKPAEPALAGAASTSEQGLTVSLRGLWFPEAEIAHKSMCPLSVLSWCPWCRWCWDRRQAYQIFICLLCRALINPAGKMLGLKWKLWQKENSRPLEQEAPPILHFQLKTCGVFSLWEAAHVLICICPYGKCIRPYWAAAHIKVLIPPPAINVGWRRIRAFQRGWLYHNPLYPVTLQSFAWQN